MSEPVTARARRARFNKHQEWTNDFLRLAQKALRRAGVIRHEYDPDWSPWALFGGSQTGAGGGAAFEPGSDSEKLVNAIFTVYSHRRTGDAPHDGLIDQLNELSIATGKWWVWLVQERNPYLEWLAGAFRLEARAGHRVRSHSSGEKIGDVASEQIEALRELNQGLQMVERGVKRLLRSFEAQEATIHAMYPEESHANPLLRELEFCLQDEGYSPANVLELLGIRDECQFPDYRGGGFNEQRWERELRAIEDRLRERARR